MCFSQLGYLNRHNKRHASGKYFRCSQCDQYFKNSVRFSMHQKLHGIELQLPLEESVTASV